MLTPRQQYQKRFTTINKNIQKTWKKTSFERITNEFNVNELKTIAQLWELKFKDGGGKTSGRFKGEWVGLVLDHWGSICEEGEGGLFFGGKEGKEEVEEEGEEEEEEVDVGMVGVEPELEFVDDEWDEEIICSICYLPLVEPTQHNQCAIAFCKKCIEKANYNCPVCQDGRNKKGFSEVRTKFILNILGRVRVFCDLCREEMGVGDFKQHQQNCGGVVVECVGKGVGCKVVRKRKRMGVHEGGCPYAIAAPIVRAHQRKTNLKWLQKEKEKDEELQKLHQTILTRNRDIKKLQEKERHKEREIEILRQTIQTQNRDIKRLEERLEKEEEERAFWCGKPIRKRKSDFQLIGSTTPPQFRVWGNYGK